MQFTSVVAVLSMALAATALPNGSPPTTPAACQQSGGTVACCSVSGISLLACAIIPDVLCGALGNQQACCTETGNTETGLINVDVCQLL